MAACRSSCDLNLRSGYKSSSSKSSSSEKEDGRFARHFSPPLGECGNDGNLLKAVVFVALFLLLLPLASPPLQPLLLVKSNENDTASFFVFSLFFPRIPPFTLLLESDDDNNKGGGVKSVVVPLDFANEVEENIIVFFERRILTRREM
tara:strand:- start:497 stop:940 length:444 start_codon:yes stop_codon:yes gene_type:complete